MFMRILFACLMFVGLSAQAQAMEKSGVRPGFEEAQIAGEKIVLFRPDIKVGEQSMGGLFEPRAEWTETARELIGAELQRAQSRLSNELVPFPQQTGEEVVLTVEARIFVDLRLDRHAGAHRLADALTVGHGQHARHRRVDQADLRIGLRPERRRRAREELRLRGDLGMDFKADHDLPLAGGALDAIAARHFP